MAALGASAAYELLLAPTTSFRVRAQRTAVLLSAAAALLALRAVVCGGLPQVPSFRASRCENPHGPKP